MEPGFSMLVDPLFSEYTSNKFFLKFSLLFKKIQKIGNKIIFFIKQSGVIETF